MRYADKGALGYACHVVDVAFNLCGVDVVATADDEVFAAAYDGDVATVVDFSDVAGFEIPVRRELFLRLFGHAPVTFEDIRALDLDAADFACWQSCAFVILHPQAHTREREADAAATAVTVFRGVWVGGEHRCLAHAVTLQNGVPRAFLPQTEGFQQQWRGAGNKQAHVANSLFGQTRLAQQATIKRRHPHENSGFGQLLDHDFWVEFRHPNHLAAVKQGTVQGHKQTVDMEDGQRVNEDVIRLPTPVIFQDLRVREQIAVCQHRAFAAACRAAGVQNGG